MFEDFSNPPNITVTDVMFLAAFSQGSLFGTGSGSGTGTGHGMATGDEGRPNQTLKLTAGTLFVSMPTSSSLR
jgi:hypothetical protein